MYTDICVHSGGEDDGKKRRRKKTAAAGVAKDGRDAARAGGGGLRIIDDEAGMTSLDRKRVNKAWEEEETEGVVCVCVVSGLIRSKAAVLALCF